MAFAQPAYLWALLLLPPLWGVYLLAHQAYVRRRLAFGEIPVLARMGYPHEFRRAHLKFGLMSLAYLLVVVALARPLGAPARETMAATGADVVVLIDTSDSMQATDIPPSRLEAAYLFLDEWLQQLQGERVGVVLFAGEPVVLCPLTIDYAAVRTFLEDARQSTVIEKGTSLGDAIRMGLDRFTGAEQRAVGRALLLLTDGEDHGAQAMEAVQEAREASVPIFVVGIGTLEGSRIPLASNPWGERLYKRYQGRDVVSRLGEGLLKKVAEGSGGAYWRLEKGPLPPLLARLRRLPGRQVHSAALQRRREWFPLFAALALLAIMVDAFISPRPSRNGHGAGNVLLRWSAGWRPQTDEKQKEA